MKGTGLAIFSEPASPVPGYVLSRILTDIKQSQEMKLTHAKLHYSRVRSPAARDSCYTLTRAAGRSRWRGAERLALLRTARTCGGRAGLCAGVRLHRAGAPTGDAPLMVCPQLSLPSAPHGTLTCCKSKLKTCQRAHGLMCGADA